MAVPQSAFGGQQGDPRQPYPLIVIENLRGGVNQNDNPVEVQQNEASDAWNVLFTHPKAFGSVMSRDGESTIIAAPQANRVLMLHPYIPLNSANKRLTAVIGTKLYTSSTATPTAWDAGNGVFSTNNRFSVILFLDNVYFTNGVEAPQNYSFDGTRVTLGAMDVDARFTKAKYLAAYKNRCFALNTYEGTAWQPHRLWWSDTL